MPVPDLVAALVAARADAVWLGLVPCADRAELAEACAAAGHPRPRSRCGRHPRVLHPAGLAAVASAAGVPARATGAFPEGARRLEVDAVRDAAGTVWTLGLREVTVLRDTWAVLTELPATGVPDETAAAMEAAARALLEHAAYRGSAVVHFALERDGSFAVTAVDTDGRVTHAGVEERTGAGILGMRLRADLGDALPPTPPAGEGWTVEARLLAHDPDRGYAPTGGRVEVLSLPVGHRRAGRRGPARGGRRRRRARPGRRHGDVLGPRPRPGARATASRPGAHERRALRRGDQPHRPHRRPRGARRPRRAHRPAVVCRAARLGRAACPTATPSPSWPRRSRCTRPTSPSSSARSGPAPSGGGPSTPSASASPSTSATAAAGTGCGWTARPRTATASTAACASTSWWTRSAPSSGGCSSAGRTRRVLAVTEDEAIRLEIDGVAHTVTREDGVVVRAPAPALVCSLLVAVGDRVTAGQPVATLESMKMLSTLTAPLTGTVTALAVLPNQQVEQGDPLLRVKSTAGVPPAARPARRERTAEAVDLGTLLVDDDGAPPADVFDDLTAYLLGFDLDPAAARALRTAYRSRRGRAAAPTDPDLLAREDAFLDLFADIGSLYRPRTEAEVARGRGRGGPDQHAGVRPRVPAVARRRPRRAPGALPPAARAGARALRRRRARRPGRARAGDVLAVPRRSRGCPSWPTSSPRCWAVGCSTPGSCSGARPRRTGRGWNGSVRATQGRQPAVTDAARDVVYHWFDEPVLSRVVAETEAEMRDHLAELAADPTGPERADRIGRLVWCPQPMRSMLLGAWLGRRTRMSAATRGGRRSAGRCSRPTCGASTGCATCTGWTSTAATGSTSSTPTTSSTACGCTSSSAYLPVDDLARASRVIARHLAEHAGDREVVVDLVVWRHGPAHRDRRDRGRGRRRCSPSATSADPCTASTSPSPRSREAGRSATAPST